MSLLSAVRIKGQETLPTYTDKDDDKYARKGRQARARALLLVAAFALMVLVLGTLALAEDDNMLADNMRPTLDSLRSKVNSFGPNHAPLAHVIDSAEDEEAIPTEVGLEGELDDLLSRLRKTESRLRNEKAGKSDFFAKMAEERGELLQQMGTLRRQLNRAKAQAHEDDVEDGDELEAPAAPGMRGRAPVQEKPVPSNVPVRRPPAVAAAAPRRPAPPAAPELPAVEDPVDDDLDVAEADEAVAEEDVAAAGMEAVDELGDDDDDPHGDRGEGYPYTSSNMRGPVPTTRYDVEEHSKEEITDEARSRMESVKAAMQHAWNGYKQYSWGKDELAPVSKSHHDAFGLGLTIIDAIDTLYIMDLLDEYEQGVDWIKTNLDFDSYNQEISVFETMIRVTGGLLASYDLSGDKELLDKVEGLVNKMMPAFETRTGIPHSLVNLHTGNAGDYSWVRLNSVLSEVGSVQMEMRALSRYTGDNKFAEAADKAFFAVENTPNPPLPGLYPIQLQYDSLKFTSNSVSTGAMGDSFYEYMLKVYLLTGKTDPRYLDMYKKSTSSIFEHIISNTGGIPHTTELQCHPSRECQLSGGTEVMEHLCCFFGGLFGLGYLEIEKELDQPMKHLKMGIKLTDTCVQSYNMTATGIGPEAMTFTEERGMQPERRKQYQLRPETVESLFYLWRITGDKQYQDQGWEIFQNIEKWCKIPTGGYSGLSDTTKVPPELNDKMDSFFLAETLKYLYLLFAPSDLISLDEFVFNTEAHPFRIFNPAVARTV